MKTILSNITMLLYLGIANAQIPSQVPKPSTNTPVDWSNTPDLIIYLILPIIIILFMLAYKFYKKKSED